MRHIPPTYDHLLAAQKHKNKNDFRLFSLRERRGVGGEREGEREKKKKKKKKREREREREKKKKTNNNKKGQDNGPLPEKGLDRKSSRTRYKKRREEK